MMAADVSSLIRVMADYKEASAGGDEKAGRDLVTRDFLGCAAAAGSKELDLDLQVPSGWERRLDLLSGETYLERPQQQQQRGAVAREVQDLNLPPPPQIDGSALDLRLLLPSASAPARSPSAAAYQSVCTLDKVRSALERAGREAKSRRVRSEGSASPASSTTSSKRSADEADIGSESSAAAPAMIATGCPGCLMYVLISTANPRCPRCDTHVAVKAAARAMSSKKPRIDLNSL